MPHIQKKYFFIIAVIILGLSIMMGCSSQRRYKVMSFLFDGVPDPSKKEVVIKSDSISTNDTLKNKLVASKELKSKFNFHPPYKERNCEACHDKNATGKLTKSLLEVCFVCHEDFTKKYKSIHGPVASGYCATCHNPHMSVEAKLLTRTGQQLCLYCHSSEQVFKNEVHKDIKDSNCTECHNPHGGDDRLMLK